MLSVQGAPDSLRIWEYFHDNDTATPHVVENIAFADGTTWDVATIRSRVLEATSGDDILIGYASSLVLINGEGGNDRVFGGLCDDVLRGGDGADEVRGGWGNDLVDGGSGDDIVVGDVGDDTVDGGLGDDSLSGDFGNDVLRGGDGQDILYGGSGSDMLDGGAGSDTLFDGDGADVYAFEIGSGQDTIFNNYNNKGLGVDPDTVLFGDGLTPSNVVLTRSRDDLKISIAGTDDTLMVKSYFYQAVSSSYVVEQLKFANGTVWDIEMVKAKVLLGTAADEALKGYDGDDFVSGGDGNDGLSGFAGNDWIEGGNGNDGLDGGTGNDILVGGNGSDFLLGDVGDDILDGGPGDDSLNGYVGNDIYLFWSRERAGYDR